MSDRISDLLRVDNMSINDSNKRKLHSYITSRSEAIELVLAVDSCIDQEELRDNLDGVIELLEYRIEVMRTQPDQFSDREFCKLHDRIQSLAAKQDLLAKEARKAVEAARIASIPLLREDDISRLKGGRRGSKTRHVW